MALTLGKKSDKSGGKGVKRSSLPTKRSINLAATEEKSVNFKIGIPAIILILVAAFAIGKFAVADPLHEPYIYTWTGNIIAGGEFKIGLGSSWGDQFFYAPSANTDPFANETLLPYRLQDDGGDLKWVPTQSGVYTVKLSLLVEDMYIRLY